VWQGKMQDSSKKNNVVPQSILSTRHDILFEEREAAA